MRTALRTVPALICVVLALTLTACGDDDDDGSGEAAEEATTTTTAQDEVCAAKDTLRSSVDSVVSDIGDGNLGEAQDGLADIQTAADDLGTAVDNLEDEEREQIEPLVDDLRNTLSSLGDSSSLADLGAGLDSIATTVGDIVTELESIGCS
jgi:hypothetical protein